MLATGSREDARLPLCNRYPLERLPAHVNGPGNAGSTRTCLVLAVLPCGIYEGMHERRCQRQKANYSPYASFDLDVIVASVYTDVPCIHGWLCALPIDVAAVFFVQKQSPAVQQY